MAEKKDVTFEEALAGLEKSASELKAEKVTLEAAIKSYEDGINYYNLCNHILNEAKQKIEVFQK